MKTGVLILKIKLLVVVLLYTANVLAHDVKGPSSIEHFPLDKVTQHIYVVHGPDGLPNDDNRGFINNPTIILTEHGVIVVDPGSSMKIGQEFLKKIHALTPNPVIAVFNTHVHGDHWLGNVAIREEYPAVPIYAHKRMIELVNNGAGEDWIKIFKGMIKGAMDGTRVVGPTVGLQGDESLKLDGVDIRVHFFGHSHTDHDLLFEVVADKAVICGDVVVAEHIPNSDVPQDSNFNGTIKAIHSLLTLPLTTYIPGHGHSGGREVPETALQFLEQLYGLVKQNYDKGLSDFEMRAAITKDLKQYEHWVNFNDLGRVISLIYLEIERETF